MEPLSPKQVLEALNWRYATKIFDPAKKIPADQWAALEASLVLTPSSFGLQPWEFVVVTNQELREQLVEHSWNQRQVADASHLLVIALRTDINEAWIDRFIARLEEIREPVGTSGGYRDMMAGFIASLDAEARKQWAKQQTYIALGQFMTATAMLGIDACPMEGFATEKYDAFRAEAQHKFGDIESAAAHYAGEGLALRGDERSSDHYANMARILRGPAPGAAGRSKTCVIM